MLSPQESLQRLCAGNQRFATGLRSVDTMLTEARRKDFVRAQSPFAVVLGCSDSRVPIEILFDGGLVHCLLSVSPGMW